MQKSKYKTHLRDNHNGKGLGAFGKAKRKKIDLRSAAEKQAARATKLLAKL